LVRFLVSSALIRNYVCDGCRRHPNLGKACLMAGAFKSSSSPPPEAPAAMWGCRTCDFDLCEQCSGVYGFSGGDGDGGDDDGDDEEVVGSGRKTASDTTAGADDDAVAATEAASTKATMMTTTKPAPVSW
jgi:hypothetical protein